MTFTVRERFDLYDEAYRIFQDLESAPLDLTNVDIRHKWDRIAKIEKLLAKAGKDSPQILSKPTLNDIGSRLSKSPAWLRDLPNSEQIENFDS